MAGHTAQQAARVHLPMSRAEIGDYLAVSEETVSRCITEWKLRGAIAVPEAHHIEILDASALREGWAVE